MCEFCHKHGEGKKWYLQAENYSESLLSDIKRRDFIRDFMQHPEALARSVDRLEDLNRLPAAVRPTVASAMLIRQKRVHYGQVVPMEDIEEIFKLVNSVVRLPCMCRQATVGTEQRYCYGLSLVPPEQSGFNKIIKGIDVAYLNGPETKGLETLTKEAALQHLRELEKKGLSHSVWTFVAPFIAGLCNCDRSDCLAMRATVTMGFPVMFRAEYVAEVNPELCNGCRVCMRACQFGAMGFGIAREKVVIDPRRCYGCGVCRANCTKNAIVLRERASVPIAANIW